MGVETLLQTIYIALKTIVPSRATPLVDACELAEEAKEKAASLIHA
jgi:hypothetical protein